MAEPQDLTRMEGTWIGDVRGTSIGPAFAETDLRNGRLIFTIRVNANNQAFVFDGSLSLATLTVDLTLSAETPGAQEQDPVTGSLVIDQFEPDRIAGRWKLSNGGGGLIWLNRSNTKPITVAAPADAPVPIPQTELVAKEIKLPAVTLFRTELQAIVARMEALAPSAKVIVSANLDGKDVSQFAAVFFARPDLPSVLDHIRLSLNDGKQPINHIIQIILSAREESKIAVQSDDRVWTSGAHQDLVNVTERYTSRLRAYFQRHGLNLNGLILLVTLVSLPEVPFGSRFVYLFVVVVVLVGFVRIHRTITRTRIYLDDTVRGGISKEVPPLVSGLIATGLAAGVAWLAQYIESKGGFTEALKQLHAFVTNYIP